MKTSRTHRLALTAIAIVAVGAAAVGCGSSGSGGAKTSASDDYGLISPGTITAALSTGDAPFASLDTNNKPVGFLVDLNREIAKRLGVKMSYKITDLKSALAGVTSGRYDMVSIGLVETPERSQNVAFTKPIYWGEFLIIVPTGSTASSPTDFAGKRVGATQGSSEADYANSTVKGAKVVLEPTDTAGISELLNGNLDALVLGGTQAGVALTQHKGKLKIATSAPQPKPSAIALNKSEKAFQDAYGKQLADLVDDGTFMKLYNKDLTSIGIPFPTAIYQAWPQLKKQVEATQSTSATS